MEQAFVQFFISSLHFCWGLRIADNFILSSATLLTAMFSFFGNIFIDIAVVMAIGMAIFVCCTGGKSPRPLPVLLLLPLSPLVRFSLLIRSRKAFPPTERAHREPQNLPDAV